MASPRLVQCVSTCGAQISIMWKSLHSLKPLRMDQTNQSKKFFLLVYRYVGVRDCSFEYFKRLVWAVFSINIGIPGDDSGPKGWLAASTLKLNRSLGKRFAVVASRPESGQVQGLVSADMPVDQEPSASQSRYLHIFQHKGIGIHRISAWKISLVDTLLDLKQLR